MPSSHDHSWLPRDRPHSGVGLLELSWSQSGPEAPAGLGREISLMPPKELILESGKRMSENALCYSLLIKLLFLKNMNSFFFFWLNSACIHWERNVTTCRGYYCALVIFKSLLIRVEFNFGIKKHCRWFYWIFMSMSQMSVFPDAICLICFSWEQCYFLLYSLESRMSFLMSWNIQRRKNTLD